MKYFGAVVLISICCAFLTEASPDRKACNRACTREMDPICGFDGETYKIFSNPCVMKDEVCTTGLSWTEARMADCLQSADKPEHCLVPCTKEYDPVCASNGKDFKIFPNKCTVKNGRCDNGTPWFETRMSDCTSERSYDEDTFARRCGKPCTREYSPICGTNGRQVKQFPNKCLLQKEGCKDGRNWYETRMTQCNRLPVADICRKPCTLEYKPVCGTDGVQVKLFANKCRLQNAYCEGKPWRQTRLEECVSKFAPQKDCNIACTREYKPVCAHNGEQFELFSNECLLKVKICKDGKNWVRSGIEDCAPSQLSGEKHCESFCTREFDQVCGFDGQGAYKIFNNPCLLKNEHCKDGHDWIQTKMTDCATFYESYEEEY